jgi:hypothetical protein
MLFDSMLTVIFFLKTSHTPVYEVPIRQTDTDNIAVLFVLLYGDSVTRRLTFIFSINLTFSNMAKNAPRCSVENLK